ncbi:MAG: class I SAM-dependent methyltransferase [Chloroflexota bacterium]
MKETGTSSEAFNHIGARYDTEFTNTELSRWFRQRVWDRLALLYQPGDHVLELGCGTGEDAIFLAKRGVTVLATDGSQAMLDETARKAQAEGVADRIKTRRLDFADAAYWDLPAQAFDGAYSNYGALNCVGGWTAIGTQLTNAIRPGGRLGLGVMGPYCVWEVLWHGLHADFRTATRRLRKSTIAHLDSKYFEVYYPTPTRLQFDLGVTFRRLDLLGLGVFLPPSDLYQPVSRRPWLARPLLALERLTAPHWPFKHLGDHYWLEMERI